MNVLAYNFLYFSDIPFVPDTKYKKYIFSTFFWETTKQLTEIGM